MHRKKTAVALTSLRGAIVRPLAVILLSWAPAATAAPAETGAGFETLRLTTVACPDRLMSALDCGLRNVNERLSALQAATGAELMAVYDRSDGRVKVRATASDTIHATRENCAEVINHVRYDAGFDGRAGVRLLAPLTRYARALLPPQQQQAEALGRVIEDDLSIHVTIEYDGERMSCEGRLIDTDIAFPS